MSVHHPSSVPDNGNRTHVWEVASGIDALYMSGYLEAPQDALDRLKQAREVAEELDEPVDIQFGGVDFAMQPRKFLMYKYWLRNAFGSIGVSPKTSIPTIRIQPSSEFLHRVGPEVVVNFYRNVIEQEMGEVRLEISRLDLYADTQGWMPEIDDRHEFVTRASSIGGYEDNHEFNGLTFGKRETGTIYVRIYNKTAEMKKKKDYYVEQVWGEKYDRSLPVIRTEFQIGRKGLRSFGISSVEDALECAPGIWLGVTEHWLSLRTIGMDSNRSRWPFAPEWMAIRNVSFANGAIGLERMTDDHGAADIGAIVRGLAGYTTSFAAIVGTRTVPETMEKCAHVLRDYTNARHENFEQTVARKLGERSFTVPRELAGLANEAPTRPAADRDREVTPAPARDDSSGERHER